MALRKVCETCNRKAVDNEFFAEFHWMLHSHYPSGDHFDYPATEARLAAQQTPKKKTLKEQIAETKAELAELDREDEEDLNHQDKK